MKRRKGRVPWWLILILILNLLIRIIPREWITGPTPSADADAREGAGEEIIRILEEKDE